MDPILVPASGPLSAKIVIIGEAPGAEEERQLQPFVGPSGQLLNELLLKAGVKRDECYVTNVVNERPPNNDIEKFLKITPYKVLETPEYKVHLARLRKELDTLTGVELIITLGATPLYALLGMTNVTQRRGSRYPFQLDNGRSCIVAPTLHPAHALYQYNIRHLILHDINRAVNTKYDPKEPRLEVHYCYAEALPFLQSIQSGMRVGFDIEVDVLTKQMTCFSLAPAPDHSVSIPLVQGGKDNFGPHEELALLQELQRILQDPSINKIGQNIKFDAGFMLQTYNIAVQNMDDTMIAFAILYPGMRKGLDIITSIYTDYPYYKDEGKQWKGESVEHAFFLYNAKDSLICRAVMDKLLDDLAKQKNTETYNRQKGMIEPLLVMDNHGVVVNHAEEHLAKREINADLDSMRAALAVMMPTVANPNSNKQLMNHFYTLKGIKPYVDPDTKKPTIAKKALERLMMNGHDEAKLLLNYKKQHKYATVYLNIQYDSDRRLRGDTNPVGTKQGRPSSRKTIYGTGANMQNLPEAYRRLLYCDPDYISFNIDLSQAENRIVAYIAADEKMMTAFSNGVDIHRLTASNIFGIPFEEVTKAQRHKGKTANHGLNYGLGVDKFAVLNGLTRKEAAFIRQGYFKTYPTLLQWHLSIQEQLRRSKTLTNLFGRRRTFLDKWDSELFQAAYSFIPQSSVADLVHEVIEWMYDSCPEIDLLGVVHDSIWFQMPKALGIESIMFRLGSIEDRMSRDLTAIGGTFHIPCDTKIGYCFGTYDPDHGYTNPVAMRPFLGAEQLESYLHDSEPPLP